MDLHGCMENMEIPSGDFLTKIIVGETIKVATKKLNEKKKKKILTKRRKANIEVRYFFKRIGTKSILRRPVIQCNG